MKKYLPIILPILALTLVGYFGFRWYRSQEDTTLDTPEVTSVTQITPLDSSDQAALDNLRRGIGDYEAVHLDAAASNAYGEIRYQFKGDKALFSVNANLPTDDGETYHVYVKESGSDTFRDLGTLELNKGGLIASNSVATVSLPLTIEVRRGNTVVLTGTINAPEKSENDELPLDNQADQE